MHLCSTKINLYKSESQYNYSLFLRFFQLFQTLYQID